jgi:hypothetical protein
MWEVYDHAKLVCMSYGWSVFGVVGCSVKVVDAMRMAVGRSQGCGKQCGREETAR